jgi:putative lipoprotein
MRNLCVLAALTLSLASPAQTRDPDPWLGPDKALHFSVSVGITGLGYTATAFLTDDVRLRLLGGGALSLIAGAAKELADLAGFGTPSWKDFTWDVIGTATGLLASWLLDHFLVTPLLLRSPSW